MKKGPAARRNGHIPPLSFVSRKPTARQIDTQFDDDSNGGCGGLFDSDGQLGPSHSTPVSPSSSSSSSSSSSPICLSSPSSPPHSALPSSCISSPSCVLANLSLSSQQSCPAYSSRPSSLRTSNFSSQRTQHTQPPALRMRLQQPRVMPIDLTPPTPPSLSVVDLTQDEEFRSPPRFSSAPSLVSLISPEDTYEAHKRGEDNRNNSNSNNHNNSSNSNNEEEQSLQRQLSWSQTQDFSQQTQELSQQLNPVKNLFTPSQQSPSSPPLLQTHALSSQLPVPISLDFSPSQKDDNNNSNNSSQNNTPVFTFQLSASSPIASSQQTPLGPPAARAPRNELARTMSLSQNEFPRTLSGSSQNEFSRTLSNLSQNLSQRKREMSSSSSSIEESLSQNSDGFYCTPNDQGVKEKSDAQRSIELANARIPPMKKPKNSASFTHAGEGNNSNEHMSDGQMDIPASQEEQEIKPTNENPFLFGWVEANAKFLPESKRIEEKIFNDKMRKDKLHAMTPQMSRSKFDLSFERLKEIATGSFGTVSLCRKRVDGCVYAVKQTLRKINVHKSLTYREVFAGAAFGQLQANQWLIRHHDAWEEDGHLFLQMEWAARGSLKAQMEARCEGKKAFASDVLLEIALQVAQGLAFMHEHGFAHLDIKPDNILECQERQYKICDFGSVASVRDNPSQIEDGDSRYQAAEALEGGYTYNTSMPKIDMFGFGATLYALARGNELPKSGPEYHTIRNGEICELDLDPVMVSLVRALIHRDPAQRPTAEEVVRALKKLKSDSPEARVHALEMQLQAMQRTIDQQNQQLKQLKKI